MKIILGLHTEQMIENGKAHNNQHDDRIEPIMRVEQILRESDIEE
jgi:hypothetical protein